MGEEPGKTKLQRAKQLKTVKIINEQEFLKLLEPYVNVEILKKGEHITEFRPEVLIKGWKAPSKEQKRKRTLFG